MARAYPVEIHETHSEVISYFNIDQNFLALTKSTPERTKNKLNNSPYVYKLPLRTFANSETFWTCSKVPADRRAFPVKCIDDFDNHKNILQTKWQNDYELLVNSLGLNNSIVTKSISGKGLHRHYLLNIGWSDWCIQQNDGYAFLTQIEMTELIRHVIQLRQTVFDGLITELQAKGKLVGMGYDSLGKPAIYAEDTGHKRLIDKAGDLVCFSPELYNQSINEWDANLAEYTLENYIGEIEYFASFLKNKTAYYSAINSFNKNCKSNNYKIVSPFEGNKTVKKTELKIYSGESAGSNQFEHPSKYYGHVSKFYNHDPESQRTAVEPWRVTKNGEYEQCHRISNKRFNIIASAYLAGCVISGKKEGKYKNTVGRAFVNGIIGKWHELGHIDFKQAHNTEIQIVESFLIRWGLIRVLDNTYKHGKDGISCKYECLIDFKEVKNTEEGLHTPIGMFNSFGFDLYRELFGNYYYKKCQVYGDYHLKEAG